MTHGFARVPLRLLCAFVLLAGAASSACAEEAAGGGVFLTLDDLRIPDSAPPPAPTPDEFETDQRSAEIPAPPPETPLRHPAEPVIEPLECPGAPDDYRDGPGFFFGIEFELYPHLPAEPYYFNQSDTPRHDPRFSWDRWRHYNRRRLRESGPRPQYGVARPSDPVRRVTPGRRYEWRDRGGGQNVRRPRER